MFLHPFDHLIFIFKKEILIHATFYSKLPKGRLKPLLIFMGLMFGIGLFPLNAQTLVWQDNFDSATINPNNWTYDFGDGCDRTAGCGWGNSELEYYTSRPENARIANGNLVIEARQESFGNSAFTSGRIKTEGRIHFMYGTLEARIKMPNVANGLWPALWTLGTVGEVWPQVGEIDILEMGAKAALQANLANQYITGATHWENGGAQGDTVASYTNPTDLSADYHIYKMVWTNSSITMYIDSTVYFSFDISNPTADNRTAFHNPHYLLLNLAVGGNYPNIFSTAGITAPLPADMLVDYVKLYQNPGDSLYIGTQHASTGNFGIYTETTPVTDSISFEKDATLSYWNNLTNITSPAPVPYEGKNVIAVEATANNWFGLGISNRYINLSNYDTGSLKFQFKTTYQGQFKFGVTSAFGQSWVNFAAGVNLYGLVRDGNWHQVSIPLSAFNAPDSGRNIDLMSIHDAFMFSGDAPSSVADFYIDNIFFSGGATPMNIAITSPAKDSIIISPASVIINTATSSNVKTVKFYNGSILLDSTTSAPFTFTWSNPAIGVDTLTAIATDSIGNSLTSAPVIIFVSNAGNKSPVVSITSPLNNASFLTTSSITINANANDSDGSIYKVDFYNGATLLGTSTSSPYTFTWSGMSAGNYSLTAIATDNGGLKDTSVVVTIIVSNPIKPTVSITSPADNSTFTPPATITITADAEDSITTINRVDFYSGSTLLGTSTTSPYSYTWNNVPNGIYTLTAKATANDSNQTVSSAVNISVAPAACTGVAVGGDYSYGVYTASGTVNFTFYPLAPITGCNSSIIYISQNGGAYAGYTMTASGSNFIYSLPIANGTAISFYFTYDTPPSGQRNSSANPHGYLVGTVCAPGAPAVSITSPANATSFTSPASITINATASDVTGTITSVSFYSGTTLLGSSTTSPYSYTWTNVTAGSYSLTAVATNNSGLSTTSLPVNVIVNNPNTDGYCGTAFNGQFEYKAVTVGGNVTFTFHPLAPIAGCTYALIYIRQGLTGGYPGYSMTASGSDFIYTIPIATGTPVSFYFTYETPPSGENNSSANPQTYTVGDNCTGSVGTPPIISITSPANNASFTEPATVIISASASDSGGTVSKVDFYNGANLIGTVTSSPFTFTWTNVPAGNYILTAKATDNDSLSTISTPVNIVVDINNSTGFCGTDPSGDFSYKQVTSGGNVNFEFHPLAPIAGCSYALIYIRQGTTGAYPGYNMTQVGPDFTFSQAIPDSTLLSVYYTYNVPSGGERNSSATPYSYTVGEVCLNALPVTLINYTASLQQDGNVAITWTTTSEQNNDYFLVEKSLDARSFTTIAKVESTGNSSVNTNYLALDKLPVNGPNYYRLTQVDKDGKKTIFGVRMVNIINANSGISVYPNPLIGSQLTVKIGTNSLQKMNVQFLNMTGNLLFSGTYFSQGNLIKVNLPFKPAAGIYLLNVEGYPPLKVLVN